jgi:hypothetical protein
LCEATSRSQLARWMLQLLKAAGGSISDNGKARGCWWRLRLRPSNDDADARAVRGAAGKEPLDEQALGKHAYKQMMAQESQVFFVDYLQIS